MTAKKKSTPAARIKELEGKIDALVTAGEALLIETGWMKLSFLKPYNELRAAIENARGRK